MPPFTCLLVGQLDEVVQCETVEADDTAEAMTKTELMLRSHAGLSAIEIWQQGQLAMKLTWADLLNRPHTGSADDS
jgi:hypothetical protein